MSKKYFNCKDRGTIQIDGVDVLCPYCAIPRAVVDRILARMGSIINDHRANIASDKYTFTTAACEAMEYAQQIIREEVGDWEMHMMAGGEDYDDD